MRIAIDGRAISIYPGIGRYCLNLVKNLAKLDNKNEYVILKSSSYKEQITENPNFKEIPVSSSLVSLGSATSLANLLRREKIDLFHATSDIAPLWCPCRLVVTIHDVLNLTSKLAFKHQPLWMAYLLRTYFKIIGQRSIKSARKIIAISENTKKDILAHFPQAAGKIEVVYEAAEDSFMPVREVARLKEVRHKYSLPEEFIFYIGSTKENKNIGGLLTGFTRLVKMDFPLAKDIKLVIAGFKHFRTNRIRAKIRQLGITERVRFAGFIAEADLPAVYSAAKLFVYPSLHEGFGIPLLEAMACNTPVVSSGLTSIPEVVGDAAILCDPRDPDELAVAMQRVLKDERLKEELIEKGKNRVSLFSWSDTARKTLAIYQQVLDRP